MADRRLRRQVLTAGAPEPRPGKEALEVLWSKNHVIALVIIAAVLWAMNRFSGLKIWHALVVLGIGAYLTAFIFGAQITAFLSRIPALFGH
jgi:hypothetical protein